MFGFNLISSSLIFFVLLGLSLSLLHQHYKTQKFANCVYHRVNFINNLDNNNLHKLLPNKTQTNENNHPIDLYPYNLQSSNFISYFKSQLIKLQLKKCQSLL